MDVSRIISARTISKKEICHLLGLYNQSGRFDTNKLNNQYFTDPILIELGISREQYKKTRIFDSIKTKIIIGRLRLDLIRPSLKIILN